MFSFRRKLFIKISDLYQMPIVFKMSVDLRVCEWFSLSLLIYLKNIYLDYVNLSQVVKKHPLLIGKIDIRLRLWDILPIGG